MGQNLTNFSWNSLISKSAQNTLTRKGKTLTQTQIQPGELRTQRGWKLSFRRKIRLHTLGSVRTAVSNYGSMVGNSSFRSPPPEPSEVFSRPLWAAKCWSKTNRLPVSYFSSKKKKKGGLFRTSREWPSEVSNCGELTCEFPQGQRRTLF